MENSINLEPLLKEELEEINGGGLLTLFATALLVGFVIGFIIGANKA